jgi:hypothetical protein
MTGIMHFYRFVFQPPLSKHGAITLSKITLNIKGGYVTLSIKGGYVTLSIKGGYVTLCIAMLVHYAKRRILFTIMLSVIMLNVVRLNVIILNVIMLNVIMLNVMAPKILEFRYPYKCHLC